MSPPKPNWGTPTSFGGEGSFGGGSSFQIDPGFGGPSSFQWGGGGAGQPQMTRELRPGQGQTFEFPGGAQTFEFPGGATTFEFPGGAQTFDIPRPPSQMYPGQPQQTSPTRPGGGFGLIGGLNGPAANTIKSSLGPSLGGLLNTVAASGVGGVVTSDPQGGGCRAGNVANVIRELFNALQIELRQCNSGSDCAGIGNGQCGTLGGAPTVGRVCRY